MRTDIHSPKSLEFDPAQYDLVGVFYLGEDREQFEFLAYQKEIQRLIDSGFRRFGGSRNCAHCGARLSYSALMVRRDSGEFLHIGETCLGNRFELSRAEFQHLRETQRLNRERATIAERRASFLAEHPIVAELLEFVADVDSFEFLNSLADSFNSRALLSDNQLNALPKALTGARKAIQARAEREATSNALRASGVVAPEGRVIVEGEIVGLKWQESAYGDTLKMTVKSTEGWCVFVSVPSDISNVDKGDIVRFTATLTRSDSDSLFAFGKRPTNATVKGWENLADTVDGDFEL